MQQPIDHLEQHYDEYGQGHVFRFWNVLDEPARRALAAQAAAIDLAELRRVHEHTRALASPGTRILEPAPVECLPAYGGNARHRAEARERGEALLRAGRVAVMVVAGGQGTRLGFEGPKGIFPLGPVTGRTLFELQAQKIRGARRRFAARIPWYVMTSPATDAPTRACFAEQKHFGLPSEDVFFLCQGMAPALDFEGRLLLESPGRIAESPNGHGGSFQALADSGALDDMSARGITTISYYQVDNPLIQLADPVFLGFHDEAGAEMSAKVVRKLDPLEKVGVLARVDGRVGIVEYTEIDDEHRYQKDADGPARLLGRQHRDPRARRRVRPAHRSGVGALPAVSRVGQEDPLRRRRRPPREAGPAQRTQARALPLRRAAGGSQRVAPRGGARR